MTERQEPTLSQVIGEKKTTLDGLSKEYSGFKERIVRAIVEYSISQAPIWQQIPNLALEAEGRTGYSDGRQITYRSKIWRTLQEHEIYGGNYISCIDLTTGEILEFLDVSTSARTYVIIQPPTPSAVEELEVDGIVTPFVIPGDPGFTEIISDEPLHGYTGRNDGLSLASDKIILRYLDNLRLLDASALVESLKIQAQKPYLSMYKPKDVEEWRAEIRDRLGLPKLTEEDLKPAPEVIKNKKEEIERIQLHSHREERMYPE